MDLNQLLERRAQAWEASKELMDRAKSENRDFTAEERGAFDKATKEVEDLSGDIRRAEDHLKRLKEFELPEVDPEDRNGGGNGGNEEEEYRQVFDGFLRRGAQDLETEQRQLLAKFISNDPEVRAAGVGSGSAGGYLVPPAFRNKIVEAAKTFGNVEGVAEVITTDTGAAYPWPTNDDTGNVGAILGENTQASEQDVTLGTDTIGAYMYTSKIVRVSLQLIQDSGFDVESWLAKKLGERIARIRNQHYTTGTGSSQPEGIVTGAAIGKTGASGQTTSVLYTDLVDLLLSVDPVYRDGNRAKWMFGDGILGTLLKLIDGDGRPIWSPSLVAGQPDTLLGRGIIPNNDMPTPAANAKTIAFGDFAAAYLVRNVRGFQLMRLAERYADYLQVGFLGFSRADGAVQDSTAVKVYRHAAS